MIESPEIEILLPVHNEGESIEAVMRELYAEISPRIATALCLGVFV